MTALPSVNGTEDEAHFSDHLVAMLRERRQLVSLAGRVEIWNFPVEADRLGRKVTALLVRGRGRRTIILTGHYDTVSIDDYADLKTVAFNPESLAVGLVSRLRNAASGAAGQRALVDLESGAFLPGRGLLDMKAGLAAGLAVAETFGRQPDSHGNILFLAVPDEEANSAGARQVAKSLEAIAAERRLDVVAAINLDSIADDGDGTTGQAVALGSVGKLLLTALVVGRPAHACYPLAGINAGALAGAIATEVEWSATLADPSRGEPGVPPTLLSIKDSKSHYDVTTPASVWMSWNALSFGCSPDDLLTLFAEVCRGALTGVTACLADRARHAVGTAASVMPDIPVHTFAALKARALAARSTAAADYARRASELAASGANLPEQCRVLTEFLWEISGLGGPAVIVGFGSLPYLPVSLSNKPDALRLAEAVTAACQTIAVSTGVQIAKTSFFQGISDVSFFGEADLAVVPGIAANTPNWGHAIAWSKTGGVAGLPTINAGPWGRDYHTPLERLHTGYAFDILPRLLELIVMGVLSTD